MRALHTGDWITPRRIRAYSLILFVLWGLGVAAVLATAQGYLDWRGRPLGTDFANVWTAGALALDGRALEVYEPLAHYQAQQAAFGRADVPYYGWHYPPFFLLIAAVLALLPYGAALGVWMAATLPVYVAVMRALVSGRLALLAALAYPAVAVNLLHGQNGYLSTGLLGAGLWWLERRPWLAGVAFGLLTFKPQFGPLLPLVLAATGRWRAFASATATVAGLALVSTLVFGPDIWPAFVANTAFTRDQVLAQGAMGWEKLQSLFAALRAVGVPLHAAYAAQGILALGVAIATVWLWRRPTAFALKAAGVTAGALLLTPYALDYDLMLLALAIGWLVKLGLEEGFLPWEKTVLAVVWAAPLVSRLVAKGTLVPLGFLTTAALFVLILRAARTRAPRGVTGS